MIHADLNGGNILIGGDRPYVVDWGFVSRGAAWIEIAILIQWLIKDGHTPREAEEWASQFTVWADVPPQAGGAPICGQALGLLAARRLPSSKIAESPVPLIAAAAPIMWAGIAFRRWAINSLGDFFRATVDVQEGHRGGALRPVPTGSAPLVRRWTRRHHGSGTGIQRHGRLARRRGMHVGRTTGRTYTTPIRPIEHGGQCWLISPYGAVSWVRNARATGEVTLRRGRRRRTGEVIECDAQKSAPILREYVRAIPVTRPYFNAKPGDPLDRFVEEAPEHPVFRLVEKPRTPR